MDRHNYQITDKVTGKSHWIGPTVVVLAKVIVIDEPNGPRDRFSNKNDIRENEIEYGVSSAISSNAAEATYTYHFVNKDYVKKTYVVINKRGEGAPSEKHKWNLPVGYWDFADKTLQDACAREVLEENHLLIEPANFKFVEYKESEHRSNVVMRFRCELTLAEYNDSLRRGMQYIAYHPNENFGEDNEVEGTELMEITNENLDRHEWAFNHKELIADELLPVVHIY